MTTPDAPTHTDVAALIDELAAKAAAEADSPTPLAEGTFAMYAMPDGGIMMVAAATNGPMEGVHHYRIPPAMMKAVAALAGGGSKLSALKGLLPGRRKAPGDGR